MNLIVKQFYRCFGRHFSNKCQIKTDMLEADKWFKNVCSSCLFPNDSVGIGPIYNTTSVFIHHKISETKNVPAEFERARSLHKGLCGSGFLDVLFLTACFLYEIMPWNQVLCEHGFAARCNQANCPLKRKPARLVDHLKLMAQVHEPSGLMWIIKIIALYSNRVSKNAS